MTRRDKFADMLEKGSSQTPQSEQPAAKPSRKKPAARKRAAQKELAKKEAAQPRKAPSKSRTFVSKVTVPAQPVSALSGEKRMFGSRVDAALLDDFEFALLTVKRERGLRRVTKEAGFEALLTLLADGDVHEKWAALVAGEEEGIYGRE